MMVRSSEEEQQIRSAAENLLGSSVSLHQQPPPSNECSINTVMSDVVPPADLVTAVRVGGRMSVVRRFFCLFVTFDLLFTVLMWLICIMLVGKSVFEMLESEIVHYSIYTSLFDVVMAATARFVLLILFYALLYINHWFIVALTTVGTVGFLLTKVFLYNWVDANSPVLQVLLIVTSFVIAWGEAWFLDFRVIPHEKHAQDYLQSGGILGANERTPLLQPYLQGLVVGRDDPPESVRNFYSPLDSPAGSDVEDWEQERPAPTLPTAVGDRPPSAAELRARSREILSAAYRALVAPGWRKEKTEKAGGAYVESRARPQGGKLYRLQGSVALPPDRLLHLLFDELDSMAKWNPTLSVARRLQVVDDHTDVSYQVMAESGGGLVAARDFVTLRRWEKRGAIYIIASASITHPSAPQTTRPVRADQGPSCWVLESTGLAGGESRLRWLLDTDLRGWVPQALLDQAFAGAMLTWLEHLRSHAVRLCDVPGPSGRKPTAVAGWKEDYGSVKPERHGQIGVAAHSFCLRS